MRLEAREVSPPYVVERIGSTTQDAAAMAGFVRGQLSVCGILAIYYAASLMLVGLQFGLVVGAVTGMISFIPYVGAIIGGALSIGLALFQFWNTPGWIGAVVGIFVVGQMLEGNFLVPNLVGKSICKEIQAIS